MKLSVSFVTNVSYAVNLDSRNLGLDFVDKARAETGVANLAIERVDGYLRPYSEDPTIPITEEIARESGLFGERPTVKVQVQGGSLNPYMELRLGVEKSDETGEIIQVTAFKELDVARVIGDWRQSGYPTKWTGWELASPVGD